jgi:predicted negative regulator of RcsB-dependent stress response
LGAKKIRISKKEAQKAKKAEELAVIPMLSMEWIEQHSGKILATLGALLLVMGLIWGFNAYGASKERRARMEYSKVVQNWPADDNASSQNWQQVITGLETYLKEHSGTAAVEDAQFDLARAYFQTRQYENALKYGQKAFDQRHRSQTLKLLAQYQLASIYEALGKTDEALAQWNALKGTETPQLSKEVYWNIARLYVKQGNTAKAAENYDLALKAPGEYPNSTLVQTELASLKLKMEGSGSQ